MRKGLHTPPNRPQGGQQDRYGARGENDARSNADSTADGDTTPDRQSASAPTPKDNDGATESADAETTTPDPTGTVPAVDDLTAPTADESVVTPPDSARPSELTAETLGASSPVVIHEHSQSQRKVASEGHIQDASASATGDLSRRSRQESET